MGKGQVIEKEKKKKNPEKIILVAVAAAAVLTPVQLAVMGWFGGIGPMRGLKDVPMGWIPGNQPEYNFDSLAVMENSPLQGKNICILGSSVAYGATSQQKAVGEYFAARLGANLTKEAVGRTTLTDIGKDSYVQRLLKKVDPGADFDLFLCQLSTNDATRNHNNGSCPLGEISDGSSLEDFDTSTVTGAMEYIIVYVKQTWGCPVVFFTGSYYDSEEYSAMVQRLLELRNKYDIGVLDLYTDEVYNNSIDDAARKLYMKDEIHPTKAGYRDWWGPELER